MQEEFFKYIFGDKEYESLEEAKNDFGGKWMTKDDVLNNNELKSNIASDVVGRNQREFKDALKKFGVDFSGLENKKQARFEDYLSYGVEQMNSILESEKESLKKQITSQPSEREKELEEQLSGLKNRLKEEQEAKNEFKLKFENFETEVKQKELNRRQSDAFNTAFNKVSSGWGR